MSEKPAVARYYLMVCTGETYQTKILPEFKLLDELLAAVVGEGGSDEERKSWTEDLANDDNWQHSDDFRRTQFYQDVGETDHIGFLLLECLPAFMAARNESQLNSLIRLTTRLTAACEWIEKADHLQECPVLGCTCGLELLRAQLQRSPRVARNTKGEVSGIIEFKQPNGSEEEA